MTDLSQLSYQPFQPPMANSKRPKRRKVYQEAFSPKDVAIILGVHHITVRRWIRERKILAYRVGTLLVRIPLSEIQRMRTLRVHYAENYQRPDYPIV